MDFAPNLINAALVIISLISLTWLWHVSRKDLSVIDMVWGLGFGIVAFALLMTADNPTHTQLILLALPMIWAMRFTIFIMRRNMGHGEDDRYTEIREQYVKKRGSQKGWLPYSYFVIYGIQAVSMLIVSLPLIIGISQSKNAPISALGVQDISWLSWCGVVIWFIGLLFEAIGDYQLNKFKKENADYDGPYAEKPLLTSGLWAYTRHPNYFGNALIWWGIGLVAISLFDISNSRSWGWIAACLMGPAYINWALVSFTGKANNERKMSRRPAYADYVKRTSGFIPWFPKT